MDGRSSRTRPRARYNLGLSVSVGRKGDKGPVRRRYPDDGVQVEAGYNTPSN
jgi:hypothetical protein